MPRHLTLIVTLAMILFAVPAVGGATGFDSPAAVAPAAATDVAATSVAATAAAVTGESAALAAREESSKKLEDFRGGDEGIYIGTTVLVVVICVLIVLILLR